MELNRAAELMKIEAECVKRQDTPLCNRDECGCQCCDLVQDADEILEAYGLAIEAINFTQNWCDKVAELMIKCGFDDVDEFQKYCERIVNDASDHN